MAIAVGGSNGSSWSARASQLADWTLRRLANRFDAWGGYTAAAAGPVTRRGRLTRALLARHFGATRPGDVLGLHAANADNRGRWCALDIDQHGDDPHRAAANERAARHWYDVLVRQGFRPLLTGSNGKGGYHLRIVLAAPTDAVKLHYFARRLVGDFAVLGLSAPPETFPKQADVRRTEKRLGNWLRLPGKHHKREYWSDIWDGSQWLAGDAAIYFLLSLQGDDPALISDVPPTPSPPSKPATTRRHYAATDNLSQRIAAYLRRLPHLSEGQGRDDVAFSFACWLVRDLAISDSIALQWLELWDAGNNPPKGRERLAEIIRSAHAYGTASYGSGLAPADARYDRYGHVILRATKEIN